MLASGPFRADALRGRRWRPRSLDRWTLGLGLIGAVLVGMLAGIGLWIVGLALILMAAFVPLAVANPERMALALIILLPWMIYPIAVGGFSVFLAIPTFGVTGVLMLMRARGASAVVARALPAKLFAILIAFAIAASLTAVEPITAITRTAYLLLFGFFAWALASSLVAGRVSREQVARAILWSAGIAGAILTFQFAAQFLVGEGRVFTWLFTVNILFGGENAPPGDNWVADGPDLIRGIVPFMTPASAGQFLMISAVVGFWLRAEREDTASPRSAIETVLLALVVVGLLATFSRQSWVGAAIGIAALGLIRRPVWMLTAVTGTLLLAFVIPFPGAGGLTAGEHLIEGADTSSQSTSRRIDLWERAVDNIPENVIIGVGPGLFGTIEPDPFHPVVYAHNIYLDAAVEIGLLGALLLIAILFLGMRAALLRRQRLPLAMLLAFAAASLYDDALYFPRNGLLVAIAFGLILGGEASRRKAAEPAAEEEHLPAPAHDPWPPGPARREREPVYG